MQQVIFACYVILICFESGWYGFINLIQNQNVCFIEIFNKKTVIFVQFFKENKYKKTVVH